MEDNDTKPQFYDIQGESVYTNPPDSNSPSIDHGLDEDYIWAFPHSVFNQRVIKNPYLRSPWEASQKTHAPFWGEKLLTPAFFKEEKMEKFYKQWDMKLGLERIKMRQALTYRHGDKAQ